MLGVSVIIPLYNEEENVVQLHTELSKSLENFDYELIFVNDGSIDNTQCVLEQIASFDARAIVIEFRRNFGQSAAIQAGLDLASKEIVCTIDGDRQNDPADIPKMVQKIKEGYDMVTGWRRNRKDNAFLRTIPSRLAAKLISFVTGVKLNDFGSPLKVLRAEIAKEIKLYGEMHRFIPVIAASIGCKIFEMPVNHRKRVAGKSKYGLSRTFRVLLDLVLLKFILSFGRRPLHFFGYAGLGIFALGGLGLLKVLIERFFLRIPAGDRPLLILSVMFIVIGLQFIFSGILAEMLLRTYHESQGKPIYAIRKIIARDSKKIVANL
ncbi:MAG: glycosyltransferase family 2 protein [Deltaproteobacteria bacterium]|nr:glycosyltransferase family 2 protein [Deltaproteobacteria bacterium]